MSSVLCTIGSVYTKGDVQCVHKRECTQYANNSMYTVYKYRKAGGVNRYGRNIGYIECTICVKPSHIKLETLYGIKNMLKFKGDQIIFVLVL